MASEPRLGCGAAIVEDGKLLLIQRAGDPESGHWGFPGGKVDAFEPVQHAVIREVREELGIELSAVELLCAVDQIDRDAAEHWVALVYLAQRFMGVPTLVEPEKHLAWGWFPLDQLPEPLTTATRVALPSLREVA